MKTIATQPVNRSRRSVRRASAPLLWLLALLPLATTPALGQSLFSDNFDTDTSGQWEVFEGSINGTPDYTVEWAADYSTNAYTFNGTNRTVPPSPNGGGTTRGVRVTVNNNDDVAAAAAVSLYPKGRSFSGEFAVQFDLWMNYNGGAYGGSGSTEHATFGIHHDGSRVNWADGTFVSDGVWFAVAGEAGAGVNTISDYGAYVGDGSAAAVWYRGVDGGYVHAEEVNPNTASGLKDIFWSPEFETAGAPGKHWVQVEVRQRVVGGQPVVTWLMDGYIVAEHAQGAAAGRTSGNLMLGYMDFFNSIANPRAENFVLFDNLRVTDLSGKPVNPVVTIVADDGQAAEPSDTATVTFSRTGDTAQALTVGLRVTGTATGGVDYEALPTSVTFAAGQSQTSLAVVPRDDGVGEPVETIRITVAGGAGYDVGAALSVVVELADDGDLSVATLRVKKPVAYESNPGRVGRLVVDLVPASLTDTAVKYTVSGTGVSGVDFEALSGTLIIPAGSTNGAVDVVPRDNGAIDADRTVVVTLSAGPGYALGTSVAGTVTVRNDDLEAGTVVYSETFDQDRTAEWAVNVGPTDGVADFFFDYSGAGVPPAPRSSGGTTRGLKLQANLTSGVFGGLSVSPRDKSFTGDIRLRFDLWQNFNGPLAVGGSGSTQITGAGIGTAGTTPQWPGGAQDSLWFAATGDGGSSVDYRAYSPAAPTGYGDASGVFAAGTTGGPRNQSHPYYAELGAEAAPAAQLLSFPNQTGETQVGAMGFQWHDAVIERRGNQVSWYVDGLRIATVDVSAITFGGGNILFNQSDINASSSTDPDAPSMAFGLIDNVRVEVLASVPTTPVITGVQLVDGRLRMTFTGGAGDSPSAFKLVGSAVVPGTFTEESGAVITAGGAAGQFVAEVAVTAGNRFFRIQR